jgi:hypothetical protein
MSSEDGTLEQMRADSAGLDHRAHTRFLWIDAESGDELIVEVFGSEDFFRELEKIGFVRQPAGAAWPGPNSPGPPSSDDRERESSPRRSEGVRLSARMDVSSRTRREREGTESAERPWPERRRA